MFFKKHGDYVVSGFFMALSITMYYFATKLPKSRVMKIGPDFMPKVIAVAMMILSIALLITTIAERKVRNASVDAAGVEKTDYRRVLMSFIMVLAYVFLLKPVGFTISSVVFLPVEMFILAPDNLRTGKEFLKDVIIGVIVVLVIYFLFRYGFKILLPRGIFAIEL